MGTYIYTYIVINMNSPIEQLRLSSLTLSSLTLNLGLHLRTGILVYTVLWGPKTCNSSSSLDAATVRKYSRRPVGRYRVCLEGQGAW